MQLSKAQLFKVPVKPTGQTPSHLLCLCCIHPKQFFFTLFPLSLLGHGKYTSLSICVQQRMLLLPKGLPLNSDRQVTNIEVKMPWVFLQVFTHFIHTFTFVLFTHAYDVLARGCKCVTDETTTPHQASVASY